MKQTLIALVIIFLSATAWVWNGVKFVACDFGPDYRCEAIHASGVFVPPLSVVTVWFGVDQ